MIYSLRNFILYFEYALWRSALKLHYNCQFVLRSHPYSPFNILVQSGTVGSRRDFKMER